MILNLITNLLYEVKPISYRNIVSLLIDWNLFRPMNALDASMFLNRLYTELSSNVHEYPDRTDFGRAFDENPDSGFEFEQKVLVKSLREFLHVWRKIFDINSVLAINILSHRKSPEETKSILTSIVNLPDYAKSDLSSTKILIQGLLR